MGPYHDMLRYLVMIRDRYRYIYDVLYLQVLVRVLDVLYEIISSVKTWRASALRTQDPTSANSLLMIALIICTYLVLVLL